jgi:hypothetical protein
LSHEIDRERGASFSAVIAWAVRCFVDAFVVIRSRADIRVD